jgi:streptogramin lyase
MLAVCDGGTVHELARVDVGAQGHGMTVDAHGGVWVCDADGGGVVRVLERAR